jgi:hypothetical protein
MKTSYQGMELKKMYEKNKVTFGKGADYVK